MESGTSEYALDQSDYRSTKAQYLQNEPGNEINFLNAQRSKEATN